MIKKKWGFFYHTQPQLTPYLGPWLSLPEGITKESSIRKFQKRVLGGLVAALPSSKWILCHAHPDLANWQPLYWLGFSQTTRFTFTLDLKRSKESIWTGMGDKTRNTIVKAKGNLVVKASNDVELLFELITRTFERQNKKAPFSKSYFRSLDEVLNAHNARKIWIAYLNQKPVAGAYISLDDKAAYLMLTGRKDEDPGGAVGLLIWTAIQECKSMGKEIFDFEGSMIESIAFFFDSFGGEQRPYHRLYRTANKSTFYLLKALNRL